MDRPPMFTCAVIPVAGRGLRARPMTESIPKALFEIDGQSLLERNIEKVHQQLGIKNFILITGHLDKEIRKKISKPCGENIEFEFVSCPDPSSGLGKGLLLVRHLVPGPFVTILGDELYVDSNHEALTSAWRPGLSGLCGYIKTSHPEQIKKNYSVELEGDRVVTLREKPCAPHNNILGVGTYVLTPEIFDFITTTPKSEKSGRVELTDAISQMARSREVHAVDLGGHYFNINSVEDYHQACHFMRARRLKKKSVSVVIPARNEESSIAAVVRDFLPHASEVVVVDNQSTDQTAVCARAAGARVETVNLGGYGDTIRHGLTIATGDVLVVSEADHSFWASDMGKFLEYLKDADMVMGTRTARPMIEDGTNMRGPVRIINILFAKLIEILWIKRDTRLSDVGCTYRAIWRDQYKKMAPHLAGIGPEFSPEMTIAALQLNMRVIEIPVTYRPRIGGESKHSKTFFHLTKTAIRMLKLTLARRVWPIRPSEIRTPEVAVANPPVVERAPDLAFTSSTTKEETWILKPRWSAKTDFSMRSVSSNSPNERT